MLYVLAGWSCVATLENTSFVVFGELGILPPYKQIFSFANFLNNKLELVPFWLGMYIRQKVAFHALAFRFRSIISTMIERA